MHKEVLTKEQTELLPIVKTFSKDFGLVGGTAIALHLGHRRSIDFDLFANKKFGNISLQNKIVKDTSIQRVIVSKLGEYTILIKGIKFTFFHFPFEIDFAEKLGEIIKLPDLLTLAAMKVYALGYRAKWKDYVDLYFILKDHLSLDQIIKKADAIFGDKFNEKLIRQQLSYFQDIDYSEKVDFMEGFEVEEEKIKKTLTEVSLS